MTASSPQPCELPRYEDVVGTYHVGCTPLPPPVTTRTGMQSYFGLPVVQPDSLRAITIDVHLPISPRRPVRPIVFASGGGFRMNSLTAGPWPHLVDNGYAVVCISYRLSGEVDHPAPAADIKAVARWVRAHAPSLDIEADKVGAFGMSAGAYLVSFAASNPQHDRYDNALACHLEHSSRLDAVAAFFPPSDFLALADDNGPGSMEQPGTEGASEVRYLGFVPSDRPERNAESSLIDAIGPDTPTHFLAHGTADMRVDIAQSDRLAAALKRNGLLASYRRIDGADHGGPEFFEASLASQVAQFFDDAFQ